MKIVPAAIGAVLASAAMGLGVLMAAPAQASTADCDAHHTSTSGTEYCYADSTGTQFRAAVTCYLNLTTGPTSTVVYGPWESQGDRFSSTASCPSGGWYYHSVSPQLR